MVWAQGLLNNRRLSSVDFVFTSRITEETLNRVIEEGEYKGLSVA